MRRARGNEREASSALAHLKRSRRRQQHNVHEKIHGHSSSSNCLLKTHFRPNVSSPPGKKKVVTCLEDNNPRGSNRRRSAKQQSKKDTASTCSPPSTGLATGMHKNKTKTQNQLRGPQSVTAGESVFNINFNQFSLLIYPRKVAAPTFCRYSESEKR